MAITATNTLKFRKDVATSSRFQAIDILKKTQADDLRVKRYYASRLLCLYPLVVSLVIDTDCPYPIGFNHV